jgi:hypothetical protein
MKKIVVIFALIAAVTTIFLGAGEYLSWNFSLEHIPIGVTFLSGLILIVDAYYFRVVLLGNQLTKNNKEMLALGWGLIFISALTFFYIETSTDKDIPSDQPKTVVSNTESRK